MYQSAIHMLSTVLYQLLRTDDSSAVLRYRKKKTEVTRHWEEMTG